MNTILLIIITILPVSFLLQLFITEYLLLKKGINIGGTPPINSYFFYISKYSVIIIWLGMILDAWNVHIIFSLPKIQLLTYAGIFFYITGFTILYIGRFSLGKNFRYGISNEEAVFITYGIYKISRNPMYLGLFLTLAGSVLFTFNILYLILAMFISIVHHSIALHEEKELRKRFGNTFEDYCKKVRRYI